MTNSLISISWNDCWKPNEAAVCSLLKMLSTVLRGKTASSLIPPVQPRWEWSKEDCVSRRKSNILCCGLPHRCSRCCSLKAQARPVVAWVSKTKTQEAWGRLCWNQRLSIVLCIGLLCIYSFLKYKYKAREWSAAEGWHLWIHSLDSVFGLGHPRGLCWWSQWRVEEHVPLRLFSKNSRHQGIDRITSTLPGIEKMLR